LGTRVYLNERNNNDVEVANFVTSKNLSFQMCSRIAVFVIELGTLRDLKEHSQINQTNVVDLTLLVCRLYSLTNEYIYAVLFTFALR
jgi:hypothetical protein